MKKRAVVLFNLGGPDCPEAVQPFLFNLFNDKAIITLPQPFRWLLAKFISTKRAPIAREIYNHIGGKSPLLELTREQADALQESLSNSDFDTSVFVCMRYWHPMADETLSQVQAFDPDEVVLLPLYPQFSSTTSGSSLQDWRRAAAQAGFDKPTWDVCCYPTHAGFINAQADLISESLKEASSSGKPRILFSAHGLPKKIIEAGDPYQAHVELTSQAVVDELHKREITNFEWSVCYQSKVGRLEWLSPSTEDELTRAVADQVPVVIVPIAFVSEHSETLVELDIEYREVAEANGIPAYVRTPAVGTHKSFIAGLAQLVQKSDSTRKCAAQFTKCPRK